MIRLLATSAIVAVGATAAVAGPITAPEAPPPVVMEPAPAGSMYGVLSLGYTPATTLDAFQDAASADFQDIEIDLDAGHLISGALGYEMDSGLRAEVELLYLHGDTGDIFFPDAPFTFTSEGSMTVTAGMVNAWYSLGGGTISPFIGGGIGLASVSVDVPTPPGDPAEVDDSDTVFAWQLGAGVDIAMSDDMSVVLSYRMLDASGLTFTDSGDDDLDADYQNHVVTAGVRFSF